MLRRMFSTSLVLAAAALAPDLRADPIVVEVSGATQKLPAEDLATMHKALKSEVEKLTPPKGAAIVVSAQVTRLETVEEKKSSTTTCVVSLAVRDKKTGALLGLTSGTSVVTSRPNDKGARAQGIEGAVQGATRGLPKLMK